jgi:hypothetical protein
MDLLAFGSSEPNAIRQIFQELCSLQVDDDGLEFHPDSIKVSRIRDDAECGGIRVTLLATLLTARITLQVDLGFGDAVTPSPQNLTYPGLLDFPPPVVRAYPFPTIVAEKYEAMTVFGAGFRRRLPVATISAHEGLGFRPLARNRQTDVRPRFRSSLTR